MNLMIDNLVALETWYASRAAHHLARFATANKMKGITILQRMGKLAPRMTLKLHLIR